jgi:glutamate-1-semialdehyde 2,1-aminomutase
MAKNFSKSRTLFQRAVKSLSGGVNSPVRAFKAVGGSPLYIERGEGAYLYDVDGNRYLDFCCSWGPLILGHAHPVVLEAIQKTSERGASFGAVHEGEILLAEKVKKLCPHLELLRFVSSGTEAVMSAIRLARAYTKRNKIVKFSGCYHGHSDYLLASAGSGLVTFGIPSSAGVPEDFTRHTLVAPLDD